MNRLCIVSAPGKFRVVSAPITSVFDPALVNQTSWFVPGKTPSDHCGSSQRPPAGLVQLFGCAPALAANHPRQIPGRSTARTRPERRNVFMGGKKLQTPNEAVVEVASIAGMTMRGRAGACSGVKEVAVAGKQPQGE